MSLILIIDDNKGVCSALEILFSLYDLQAVSAHTPAEGLAILDSRNVSLVVQDMNFSEDTTSGKEGVQLFGEIRRVFPDLPIILLTAWTHLESAVELVKQGAADYLAKPWDDDKFITSVQNLLELSKIKLELEQKQEEQILQRKGLDGYDLCGTVFESSAMLQILLLTIQVADSDLPVLITGPNGSGKEKIAEIIHRNCRRKGEMVRTNAGAMPADLIESELFGSVSGAFTGAKDRDGRFTKADGGTLFLDEIGNLPLQGQMKLLRVLQTGEFERLGSSETCSVDVRLICATNSDLPVEIKSRRFREDLYYRINVIEIKVPSLNQRPADIMPLVRHFLKGELTVSDQAQRALTDYHWPGNVRELENCMQRARLLNRDGVISLANLGLTVGPSSEKGETESRFRDVNRSDISDALQRYNGVVSRAAKSVGLSRQSFYRRMENYGLKE
ncbi:MAG: DNA-binding NtrC family response regulator [Oceanicoccus sp.]